MGHRFGEADFPLCGRDSFHGWNDHIHRIQNNAQDEKGQRTLRRKGGVHSAFHLNGNTICLSSPFFFFLLSKEDTGTRDDASFDGFDVGSLGGVSSGVEKAAIDSKSIELPLRLFGIHTQSWSQNKLTGGEPWNQRARAPNREHSCKRHVHKCFDRLTSPVRTYPPGNNKNIPPST